MKSLFRATLSEKRVYSKLFACTFNEPHFVRISPNFGIIAEVFAAAESAKFTPALLIIIQSSGVHESYFPFSPAKVLKVAFFNVHSFAWII